MDQRAGRALLSGRALVAITAIAIGGVCWWVTRESAPTPPQPPATTTPAIVEAPVPQPAAVDFTPIRDPGPDRSRLLELPDGSFVRALNGAVGAAPIQQFWGPMPWSPIVGVERSEGVDWYRHANGSYSTTQMVRADNGSVLAMTRVGHQGPQAPPVSR